MSPQLETSAVHADYDREADALYIQLRDGEVARTIEVDDSRILDLADDGTVVGIEVLYPAENLAIASLSREYGFEHLLDAIDDAVAAKLGAPIYPRVAVGIALNYRFEPLTHARAFTTSTESTTKTVTLSGQS